MITADTFRAFALSLPETDEAPHGSVTAFRVKKKIFATLNAPHQRATLRFSPELQDVFVAISNATLYPVPNKWGKFGWTHIDLEAAEWALGQDALQNAWWEVASPALRKKYPALHIEAE